MTDHKPQTKESQSNQLIPFPQQADHVLDRIHLTQQEDPRHDKTITKTYLYNFDLIKPHFYTVNLGFTGVYIIFSYFCSKI